MHCALLLLLTGPLAGSAFTDPGACLEIHVPPQPARVELLEGRAYLAGPEGVRELARAADLDVEGAAHLELRPRSRVALRWNATASLVVLGPAVVEWGPVEGSRTLLECRFDALAEAHVEVRRGPVRFVFPGGWAASIESGAGFVRGLSNGGVELHHDAGLPLLIAAPHERSEVRPPWVVLAGAWLRLHPGELHPEMLHGSRLRLVDPFARRGSGPLPDDALAAWAGFAWPWEGLAAVPDAALRPDAALQPDARLQSAEDEEGAADPASGQPTPEPRAPQRSIPEGLFFPPTQSSLVPRPYASGGVLRLTPWGVRRFGGG
jgi:hypothetical protein